MTIEEKAKAYDEALKRARAMHDVNYTDSYTKANLEEIFPELRESEDERTRNEIIAFIEQAIHSGGGISVPKEKEDKWIAYLEKQKEASKAIEAVDRIDKYIDDHLANAHDMKDSNPDKKYYRGWDDTLGKMAGILQDVYSEKENKFAPRVLPCSTAWFEDGEEKQKEQKPAEWSEKDETIIEGACNALEIHGHAKLASMLKSLRPRPSWKPSEELLDALYIVANLPELEFYGGIKDKIWELFKQLKSYSHDTGRKTTTA